MSERKKNDFYWSEEQEPHVIRRREILKKYPQIKDLFGVNPMLKFTSSLWVVLDILVALNIHRVFDLSISPIAKWSIFLALTYFVGATIVHALFLAIHEITHYIAFKSKGPNNFLAYFINIPILFPYAMSFKYYHNMHHYSQGKDGVDADIPLKGEAMLFKGIIGKTIWYVTQIFFYAFRPMFVKKLPFDKWTVMNWLFTWGTTAILIYVTVGQGNGWYGIFYLLLALLFAGGLHPTSGHFISEHYVFDQGQETYSYYGPLNLLTYNVGYHNEHHDFPNIAGKYLPKVKEIAGEYYNDLHSYNSWTAVIWKFLTRKDVTLFSRTKRKI